MIQCIACFLFYFENVLQSHLEKKKQNLTLSHVFPVLLSFIHIF